MRFLEHRLLYRPRSSHEFDVLASSLEITPAADIREIQDVLVVPMSAQNTDDALATVFAVYQAAADLSLKKYGMRALTADERTTAATRSTP